MGRRKKHKKLKRLLVSLLLIALIAVGIYYWQKPGPGTTEALTVTSYFGAERTLIAHRGYSGLYPQNTLAAFEAAAKNGFDAFEFDIHTTKDGVWVVLHNDTINEMTDGEGKVSDYTYDELMQYRIDAGHGIDGYKDLKIPTLGETLDICVKYDIFPVIEIKNCDASKLGDMVQAVYDRGLEDKALIISFGMDYLKAVRKIDTEIRMAYLSNDLTKNTVDQCIALGNTGIDINLKYAYKMYPAIRYAQENGLFCCAWTVDFPILADVAHWIGIDAITTNYIRHK